MSDESTMRFKMSSAYRELGYVYLVLVAPIVIALMSFLVYWTGFMVSLPAQFIFGQLLGCSAFLTHSMGSSLLNALWRGRLDISVDDDALVLRYPWKVTRYPFNEILAGVFSSNESRMAVLQLSATEKLGPVILTEIERPDEFHASVIERAKTFVVEADAVRALDTKLEEAGNPFETPLFRLVSYVTWVVAVLLACGLAGVPVWPFVLFFLLPILIFYVKA